MIGVIFDKEAINDAHNLLQHIGPTDIQNLIFIVVDNHVFSKLQVAKNKKDVVNKRKFIESIEYHLCGMFDRENNKIYLEKCNDQWVKLLLETINKYFEDTVEIVIPLTDATQPEGFKHPHPCFWNKNQVCGRRQNTFFSEDEKQNTFFELEYMKMQNGDHCTISLEIDKESLDYLKYITKAGVTVGKKGDRSQKEVFGRFNIVKSGLKKSEIIHTLKLDKTSIIHGTEDQISTTASLYTFHSHPFNAYLLYNTKFGVPSASDYWAVYTMCKKTNAIVHFVSSLEGLYVISCVPDSEIYKQGNPEDIKKLIWKKFKITSDNQVHDLDTYIQMVNSSGLFKLVLLKWDNIKDHDIVVSFNKVGKSCLIHD